MNYSMTDCPWACMCQCVRLKIFQIFF